MTLTCDKTGTYKSADGKTDVHYYVWTPEKTDGVKGIFQISHGMNEHAARYDHLARFMTKNGYAVCLNEHLGHGKTGAGTKTMGHMGDKGGDKALVKDLRTLFELMKKDYPGAEKYYLFGHSMGSFIARAYIAEYGADLTGAIISGTSGGGAQYAFILALIKALIAFKGAGASGETFNKINHNTFNKRFKADNHANAWLSRDKEVWANFQNDELTRFSFTLGGFRDMTTILREISKKSWAEKIPAELPLFFMSGLEDPVGDFGRGVLKVYDKLQRAGHTNTYIRLYEGGRHEMINETNKDEVLADILFFVENGDMTKDA